jgi:hypothetical protein
MAQREPHDPLKAVKIIGDRKVSSLLNFKWSERHDSTLPDPPQVRADGELTQERGK